MLRRIDKFLAESMHLRLREVRKHRIVVSVAVGVLCAIGLLYSSALRQKDRAVLQVRPAIVPGISGISGAFSFADSTAKAPAPRVVVISAESLLAVKSDAPETPAVVRNAAPPITDTGWTLNWQPAPGMISASRPSMLYFRRSLPTFDEARTDLRSRNLLASSAARYLDTPFESLLESVFRRPGDEESVAEAARQKQEPRNPFTEAKQRAEAEPQAAPASRPSAPEPAKDPPPPSDQDTKAASDTNAQPSAQPPAGGTTPNKSVIDGPFVILGDFAGSGTVEARSANRIDDGTFAFNDGLRTFNLYINPAAVDLQRSFALDDFNNDGVADLIVTSRSALFGGVLLGDGKGGYQLFDTFVTGYEPTVPVPGPVVDSYREILSVNIRTGMAKTFRRAGTYRQVRGQSVVNFIPDFLARITKVDSGEDCLVAAQSGKAAEILRWKSDGSLAPSGDGLVATPGIALYKDFLLENALSNLQVFQAGSSASVMLSDSRGGTFNVANFRVFPGIFLMVGDISRRGTLDVAVAYVLSATPGK